MMKTEDGLKILLLFVIVISSVILIKQNIAMQHKERMACISAHSDAPQTMDDAKQMPLIITNKLASRSCQCVT